MGESDDRREKVMAQGRKTARREGVTIEGKKR